MRALTALVATLLAASALARDVTLPTGRTVSAEVVTDPAEGTIEHAIMTTIKTITAGDFSTFLANQCDPATCGDPLQQEQMTTYNLPAAQRTAGACLQGDGDNELVITRRREEGPNMTVYLWCGDGRMPAPSTWKQIDGVWRTNSFSW